MKKPIRKWPFFLLWAYWVVWGLFDNAVPNAIHVIGHIKLLNDGFGVSYLNTILGQLGYILFWLLGAGTGFYLLYQWWKSDEPIKIYIDCQEMHRKHLQHSQQCPTCYVAIQGEGYRGEGYCRRGMALWRRKWELLEYYNTLKRSYPQLPVLYFEYDFEAYPPKFEGKSPS